MPIEPSAEYASENAKLARTPVYILDFPDVGQFSMYVPEVMRDIPVGYWRLGEPEGTVAKDLAKYKLPGTYVGSPTHGVTGPLDGDTGTGVDFNGSSQWISWAHATVFDLTSFTIEMYVKVDLLAGTQTLLAKQDAGSSPSGSLVLSVLSTGALRLARQGIDFADSDAGAVSALGWAHVVVTFDLSTSPAVRFMVDGVDVGTSNGIAGPFTANTQTLLAARAGAGNFFGGSLSHIALYAYALTPARAAEHEDAARHPRDPVFYTHWMHGCEPAVDQLCSRSLDSYAEETAYEDAFNGDTLSLLNWKSVSSVIAPEDTSPTPPVQQACRVMLEGGALCFRNHSLGPVSGIVGGQSRRLANIQDQKTEMTWCNQIGESAEGCLAIRMQVSQSGNAYYAYTALVGKNSVNTDGVIIVEKISIVNDEGLAQGQVQGHVQFSSSFSTYIFPPSAPLTEGDVIAFCAICSDPTRLFVTVNGVVVIGSEAALDLVDQADIATPSSEDIDPTVDPTDLNLVKGAPGFLVRNMWADTPLGFGPYTETSFFHWRGAKLKRIVQITTASPLTPGYDQYEYEVQLEAREGYLVSFGNFEWEVTLPLTWSITGGALPAGLSMSSAGLISGTPTEEGEFSFTVRVIDNSPSRIVGTKVFALTIGPTPALTVTTVCPLSQGAVGTPYSATFQATGGISPYAWALLSGSLPAGLSMNAAGVISGTPTTVGNSSFTVRVTDDDGETEDKSCSLEIISAAGSFTGPISIDMQSAQIFDDGVQTAFKSTTVRVNPSEVPGVVASHFEAVIENGAGASRFLDLVDEVGTVYASLEVPAGAPYTRIREPFTLAGVTHDYMLRTRTTGNFDIDFYDSKLIFDVEDGAIAVPSYSLIAGDQSASGGGGSAQQNDNDQYADFNSTPSYAHFGFDGLRTASIRLYKKDESKLGVLGNWRLEVNAKLSGVGSGFVALYNETTGQMVAGTEIEFTETNVLHKNITFSNGAANFTNGDEFGPRFKVSDDAGGRIDVAFIRLRPILSPATKGELHHKVGPHFGGTSSTAKDEVRWLHEDSKYLAGCVFTFEMTGIENVGAAAQSFLRDDGSNDSGTGGTDVGASALNFAVGTRSRQRSGALTLVDGSRYILRISASAGNTVSHSGAYLIVEVPEA